MKLLFVILLALGFSWDASPSTVDGYRMEVRCKRVPAPYSKKFIVDTPLLSADVLVPAGSEFCIAFVTAYAGNLTARSKFCRIRYIGDGWIIPNYSPGTTFWCEEDWP